MADKRSNLPKPPIPITRPITAPKLTPKPGEPLVEDRPLPTMFKSQDPILKAGRKRYTGEGRSQREAMKFAVRRREAVELYKAGLTMTEVGKALGYAVSTVCNDLAFAYSELRRACLHDLNAHRQRELDRLDLVELQAWAAYERSTLSAICETKVTGGELKSARATVVKKDQAGDPRFLEIILRCVADRRKILGLDEPTRSESTVKADVSIGVGFVPRSQMQQVVLERMKQKQTAFESVKEPQPN